MNKNNGRRRTNKPNSNGKRDERVYDKRRNSKTQDSEAKYGDNSNDPAWYAKNPQLLKDAASLAFSNRTGDLLELGIPGSYKYSLSNPGICVLKWVPSVGKVSGSFDPNAATDPINMAALNIYSYVRHANSGSANYDAPDLMAAIMAADCVFSLIAHLIRAYGVARLYDQKNRYLPKALLTSLGFNAGNILNNLANFRYMINNVIAKASVIWVPSNMSLVTRHFWMNSNIYKDADTSKAQLYAFVPKSTWKFEPAASTTGSSCSVVDIDFSGYTVDQIGYFMDQLLDPIISDEDMGIMFGDMLKAYGKENLYSINMISEDYIVMPTFNKEVLMQIHNSIALQIPLSGLKQSSSGVLYEESPEQSLNSNMVEYFGPKKYVFDYIDMVPEPENIMVASRLMQRWRYNGANEVITPTGGSSGAYIMHANINCGTERVYEYRIYYFATDGTLSQSVFWSFLNESEIVDEAIIELMERFDWAPLLYLVSGHAIATDGGIHVNRSLDVLIGDLDNYTVVDPSVLDKMDRTAVLSEFDVPLML